MALLNPYCTVAQVRAELKNTDDAIETQIEEAINQASRFIDDYKGRDYYFHDHSSAALVADDDSGYIVQDWIFLPHRPVITLTEVKTGDDVWELNVDYRVKPDRLISLNCHWPRSNDPDCYVKIKGTFGYAQASAAVVPTLLPEQINKAAVLIAAALTGHNKKEIIGLDGGRDLVIDKVIPKTAFMLLGSGKVLI